MRTLFLLAFTAILVAGCASGPTITSNTNPEVNMAGFSTFNFMTPLNTDRDNGVRTPLSSMLMSAMSREMSARGFKQSDSPDLLINFFVNIDSRMQVRQTPTMTGPTFHSYRRGRYRGWNTQQTTRTTVTQYERGTLSIDLVDASGNMLAWEGVAQQRLRNSEISQKQVDEVVAQVMAEFMHRAN